MIHESEITDEEGEAEKVREALRQVWGGRQNNHLWSKSKSLAEK